MLGMIAAGLVLIVGLILARILRRTVDRFLVDRLTPQYAMIVSRAVHYLVVGLVVAVALHQAGLNLSILLGAAGVLTVALGFASQTSASNLISGLFLMAEAPFQVGDVIRVGTTTGEVRSVDLLSVQTPNLRQPPGAPSQRDDIQVGDHQSDPLPNSTG